MAKSLVKGVKRRKLIFWKKTFQRRFFWKMWKTLGENLGERQGFARVAGSFPQSFPHFQQAKGKFFGKTPFCAFCTSFPFNAIKVEKRGNFFGGKNRFFSSVFGKIGEEVARPSPPVEGRDERIKNGRKIKGEDYFFFPRGFFATAQPWGLGAGADALFRGKEADSLLLAGSVLLLWGLTLASFPSRRLLSGIY